MPSIPVIGVSSAPAGPQASTDPAAAREQDCRAANQRAAMLSQADGRRVDEFGFVDRTSQQICTHCATDPVEAAFDAVEFDATYLRLVGLGRDSNGRVIELDRAAASEVASEVTGGGEVIVSPDFEIPPLADLQTLAEKFPHAWAEVDR